MNNVNPFMVFQKETPEISAAFGNLITAISTQGSLDDKTRQLLFIGIKASQGDVLAVTSHVPMAKQAGASREEIRDTIITTLTITGTTGISSCLVPALECYDTNLKKEDI